jgi:uncharacterized membrane protein
VDRSRLESFSDGVFAVAITLLALDLAVPGPGHGALLSQLGHRWPSFVAYLISFFTVGVIWVNHHALVLNIAAVDRALMYLNLLLLLFVVAIPFVTSTMAEYLPSGGRDAEVAMALYALVFETMGIAFTGILEWTLRHDDRLRNPPAPGRKWLARWRFYIGQVVYVAAIGVSFASPPAALAMTALVAVYYMTPAPHVLGRDLSLRYAHSSPSTRNPMRNHSVTVTGGRPAEPDADGKPARQASKRHWIVGFAVATILLYVAFLRLSWTFQVNSDGANIELMAWDMLHGNWLLHGWYAFDVPYLTTELPQYAGIETILGLTPVVTHVAAAMTYTLSVLLAMILAKGTSTGRAALVRVLIAGGIMLAPQYNQGVFILVLSVGHIGASVPLLAILILLDRAEPRWQIAALTGLLLAWATMGDSLTYVLGSIPLAVACAYRLARRRGGRYLRGDPGGSSPRAYTVQLAIAALASIGVAEAALKVIHALGGFNLYPVQFQFMGLQQIGYHLSLTWRALLVLFGADYYHHQHGIWLVAAGLHFAGMALAAFAVGWGIWRYLRGAASLTEQVMTGGIVVNVILFATSNVARMDAHELAIVLPFSAVLAGRTLTSVRIPRARLVAVAGAAVLAGYLACLIGTDTLPPTGPGEDQLASFLETHHLTHGIAGYWEASIVTVDTHDQVTVRAITDFKKFLWGVKGPWYSGYANFIVEEKGYDFQRPSQAITQVRGKFGAPRQTYVFGDYVVMVYGKNLLSGIHGTTY